MTRATRKCLLAVAGLNALAVLLFVAGCASGSWKNPHGTTFNGVVQSVETEAHRLTIAPLKSGEPVVFIWNEHSRFWANGLRVDPSFLRANDGVRIHYQTNSGQWAVQHLYLQTHRTVH